MADITQCVDIIPDKYLTSHDYESAPLEGHKVLKYELYTPAGKVPRDLAFCRWSAIEHGVTMMPNSFFYFEGDDQMSDEFVRFAICKDTDSTQKAIDKLLEGIQKKMEEIKGK